MVGLLELDKQHYYDPAMWGANSLKYVLPAIFNSSAWFQQHYSQPIYSATCSTAPNRILSKNFTDWTWIETNESKVVDAYSKLPKLFIERQDSEELIPGGTCWLHSAYAKFHCRSILESIARKFRVKKCNIKAVLTTQ